ncbi:MAG TPA: hypothetical protein VJS66_02505 [Burkholderiales bacterium]|nr:hypothetical protein [Burkholderiales bacterium]
MSRNAAVLAVLMLCAPPHSLFAAEKLYIQDPAAIDLDAGIDPAVREQCKLGERLSFFLQQNIKKQFDVIASPTLEDAGDAKALSLIVQNAQGDASGGAWFGRKGVTLRGTLSQNGKVIASFNARRRSTGGVLGPFKEGCEIFDRCVNALAEDVAQWLEQPRTDAWLGELREK